MPVSTAAPLPLSPVLAEPSAGPAGAAAAPGANRPATAARPGSPARRGSSRSGLSPPAARTIIETAACPPALKRGDGRAWAFADFRVQARHGVHCIIMT